MPVVTGMNMVSVKAGYNALLTDYAIGYMNTEMIGKFLSPLAGVPTRTGNTIEFDDATFELYDDDRAPGGPFNEIETGYTGKPYKLSVKGLAYKVPEENNEEAEAASINLGRIATNALMDAEALKIEVEQATAIRNTANYGALTQTLSGTSQFSDYTNSQPDIIIDGAKLAIAGSTGKQPNVMGTSATVAAALKRHPRIVAQFRPTSSRSLTDEELAEFFGVERLVVGDAVYRNPTTNAMEFVWGKDIALLHVDPRSLQQSLTSDGKLNYRPGDANARRYPSKFYTYVKDDHPRMTNPFWWQMNNSWYYQIMYDRTTVVASSVGGYLIKNAIA